MLVVAMIVCFLSIWERCTILSPIKDSLNEFRMKPGCRNTMSTFNNFGLSDSNGKMTYYPKFQSFVDRKESMGLDDPLGRVYLDLKRADDYLQSKGISKVDFLKVDTEGYELRVLKGFGYKLSTVRFIQFEYGGTYRDAGIQLKDVIDYLTNNGFGKFSYLSSAGLVPITNYADHYQYCNVFCSNLSFNSPPVTTIV